MKRFKAHLPGKACIHVVTSHRTVQVLNGDEFTADTDLDSTILDRMRLVEKGTPGARFEEIQPDGQALPDEPRAPIEAAEEPATLSPKPGLNSKSERLAAWLIEAGHDADTVAEMDREALKAAVKAVEV